MEQKRNKSVSRRSREELLGSLLFLGLALLDSLLDLGNLVNNTSITWSKLLSLDQVLESSILLLQTLVGKGTAVVRLGLVSILGLGRFGNLKRICGPALSLTVFLELVGKQRRVGMQGKAECLHLLGELLGIVLAALRVFVQVAQALLVLVETEVKIAALESSVTVAFEIGSDLEAERSREFLALVVLGEILVWVASRIRNALGRILVVLAGELTAVHHSHILKRLIVGGLHILDFANDALAVDDLTKNHVLAVEVGSRNGGNKELTAIGAGAGVGHGKQERTVMLEVEVLVGELFTVDGLAAGTVERGKVTTLNHELLDNAVED
jgi:hypothetical protein